MGSYEIKWKGTAERDLRKLDKQHIPGIVNAVESLSDNPYPTQYRKLQGSERNYRIRSGDYRVIYEVDAGMVVFSRLEWCCSISQGRNGVDNMFVIIPHAPLARGSTKDENNVLRDPNEIEGDCFATLAKQAIFGGGLMRRLVRAFSGRGSP